MSNIPINTLEFPAPHVQDALYALVQQSKTSYQHLTPEQQKCFVQRLVQALQKSLQHANSEPLLAVLYDKHPCNGSTPATMPAIHHHDVHAMCQLIQHAMRKALEPYALENPTGTLDILYNVSNMLLGVSHHPENGHDSADIEAEIARLRQRVQDLEQTAKLERDMNTAFLDATDFLVVVLDRQGHVVQFNRASEHTTGFTAEEIVGKPIWDELVPPEQVEGVKQVFHQLAFEHMPNRYENHWLTKQGERRLMSWSNTFLRNEEGEVMYVIGTAQDITDQRQAEIDSKRSKLLLQEIIDNAPAVIYAKDLEGRFTIVNKQHEETVKQTRDDIIGKRDSDLVPQEQADIWIAQDQHVIDTCTPIQIEEGFENEDGHHTYLTTKFPIFNTAGQVYAIGGISTDITERKRMEEQLLEREERLQFILEGSNDGAWDTNLVTGETFFSQRYADMFGYAPEELEPVSATWFNAIHPDDAELAHEMFQNYLDGNIPSYECEHRLQHKSGTWRWTLSRGKITARDEHGNPIRMTGTIRDITERKEQEQQLHTFRALTENAPDMVAVGSFDGLLTYVNESYRVASGHGEALVGMPIADLHGGDVEHKNHVIQTMIEQGIWQGIWPLKCKDGHIMPTHLSGFLIRNDAGEPFAMGAIIRDITEQQRAEEERLALQEQVIQAQQATLRELSTPLLPLAEKVLAMPLVGTIDSNRAQQVMEALLEGIASHHAEVAIVDITGVRVVDTQVAQALIRTAQAVRLLGAQVILTGIQPQIAQTLVHLGADMSGIVTRSTLQNGIAFAMDNV